MQVARVDDAAAAAAGVGAALDAACSGELTSAALSQHLIKAGAYKQRGRDNPLAKHSQAVLDKLPKMFVVQGTGETSKSLRGRGPEERGGMLRPAPETVPRLTRCTYLSFMHLPDLYAPCNPPPPYCRCCCCCSR